MRVVHDALKSASAPRPRVAVIEWTDPIYAGGHWVPEQVARAGGVDMLSTAGTHSVTVSPEQLRSAAPEIVIVAPCGFGIDRALDEAAGVMSAHPWLTGCQVWAMDGNALTSRPGPHLVNGIEAMARIFAPTLFSPADPAQVRRVAG